METLLEILQNDPQSCVWTCTWKNFHKTQTVDEYHKDATARYWLSGDSYFGLNYMPIYIYFSKVL